MDGELPDWELLHSSDSDSITLDQLDEKSRSLSEADGVPFGVFRSDHFSVDNLIKRSGESTDQSENDSAASESPNWRRNLDEVLVDVSSGQSDEHRSRDAFVEKGLGFPDSSGVEFKTEIPGEPQSDEVKLSDLEVADAQHIESQVDVEEISEIQGRDEDLIKCLDESGNLEVADVKHVESQYAVEETLVCDPDSSNCWSDSGGQMSVSGDATKENEMVSDNGVISTEEIEGNEVRLDEREAGATNPTGNSGSDDEKRRNGIVWWKMPFVLLKYYAIKIGPVWTVSMAATVIGLALLGRRLYHMKKKAQKLQIKFTINDKKVARVMGQAARLNEAFTEVRRVPVIRPALPSRGANPWPVLSLR